MRAIPSVDHAAEDNRGGTVCDVFPDSIFHHLLLITSIYPYPVPFLRTLLIIFISYFAHIELTCAQQFHWTTKMVANKSRLYIGLYPSGVINNEERRQ